MLFVDLQTCFVVLSVYSVHCLLIYRPALLCCVVCLFCVLFVDLQTCSVVFVLILYDVC